MSPEVEAYCTHQGARIYRLPLHLFPGFWGHAHVICKDRLAILVDVGSGFGDSSDLLAAGLESVRHEYGEPIGWEDLTHILITHGHIDHFGGLADVRARTRAPVLVHELDLRVLTDYEQRLATIAHRLSVFLVEAGVEADERDRLMSLYMLNKHLFRSTEVEIVLRGSEVELGPLRILHVPGHCPGQVVVQVDDILLTADHVLPEISPHQAPEALSLYTGLGHYLDSLERLLRWVLPVRLALGGHRGPMTDVRSRVVEIQELHRRRLARVLELLEEPHTVAEVAGVLFPEVEGYESLLALEEAGAHVEYLHQRGQLKFEDRDEPGGEPRAPIRYRQVTSPPSLHVAAGAEPALPLKGPANRQPA